MPSRPLHVEAREQLPLLLQPPVAPHLPWRAREWVLLPLDARRRPVTVDCRPLEAHVPVPPLP